MSIKGKIGKGIKSGFKFMVYTGFPLIKEYIISQAYKNAKNIVHNPASTDEQRANAQKIIDQYGDRRN